MDSLQPGASPPADSGTFLDVLASFQQLSLAQGASGCQPGLPSPVLAGLQQPAAQQLLPNDFGAGQGLGAGLGPLAGLDPSLQQLAALQALSSGQGLGLGLGLPPVAVAPEALLPLLNLSNLLAVQRQAAGGASEAAELLALKDSLRFKSSPPGSAARGTGPLHNPLYKVRGRLARVCPACGRGAPWTAMRALWGRRDWAKGPWTHVGGPLGCMRRPPAVRLPPTCPLAHAGAPLPFSHLLTRPAPASRPPSCPPTADRAVQELGGDWVLPLRRQVPVCARP